MLRLYVYVKMGVAIRGNFRRFVATKILDKCSFVAIKPNTTGQISWQFRGN
jgi:hypothetical protein